MKRRDFALALAATPVLTRPAWAAGEPVEGTNYARLSNPVPVAVKGKIEVIEFFGYWCPHCNQLEPMLEAWVKRLPADVNFRRIPAGWAPFHEPYRKLYFALEALGVNPDIHPKVFNAVHVQRLKLDDEAVLKKWAQDNGIDGAKLVDTMNSFSMNAKVQTSKQLFASYRASGVPTLAVNGLYVTGPEKWNSEPELFAGLDALIAKARAGR